ncbi:MAG: glycosyltransferase family 2 protein [Treponema sp.]|jgi:glycosyltransferase involved in cell wall biosynthesis|nr:glycosyltransferase family 2 protein [Treponema sp.]
MTRHTYSVIIPHYNDREGLTVCLNSIPERNDIQVIVVDDCSASVSIKTIENLKKKWGDYLVLSTGSNKGGGAARNIGLDRADGKWLLFADADDSFTEDAFSAFDAYGNSDYDIVFFTHSIAASDGINQKTIKKISLYKKYRDEVIQEYNDSPFSAKNGRKKLISWFWEPWAKLFSRDFIKERNIRFEETRAANDAFFYVSAGTKASALAADDHEVYIYTIKKDSTERSYNREKDFDRLTQRLKINRFLIENHCFFYRCTYVHILARIARRYGLKTGLQALALVFTYMSPFDLWPFTYHNLRKLIK